MTRCSLAIFVVLVKKVFTIGGVGVGVREGTGDGLALGVGFEDGVGVAIGEGVEPPDWLVPTAAAAMVKVRIMEVAAEYMLFPGCDAVMLQEPAEIKVIMFAETEHVPDAVNRTDRSGAAVAETPIVPGIV